MPCRAGITTEPEERKRDWESKVIELRNWTLYGPYDSKTLAQNKEDELIQRYGCEGHPGGPNVPGPWYAYKFDYTREK